MAEYIKNVDLVVEAESLEDAEERFVQVLAAARAAGGQAETSEPAEEFE